ncbi:MAG: hypothetical protein H6839_13330 [Planctomycetes bacterium]|nr:hypothetical protein [Planctomycetota bacterium]
METESKGLLGLFESVFAGRVEELSEAERTNLERLKRALLHLGEQHPLSRERLNQLLHLLHQAGMSKGFFDYYFVNPPQEHLYDTSAIRLIPDGGEPIDVEIPQRAGSQVVTDIGQLLYGVGRFVYDALLLYGNVRTAYRELRRCTRKQLEEKFAAEAFDETAMARRLGALKLEKIDAQDRYLVGETAQGHFGRKTEDTGSRIEEIVLAGYRNWKSKQPISIKQLVEKIQAGEIELPKDMSPERYRVQPRLDYLKAGETRLETVVSNEAELEAALASLRNGWKKAWERARVNTDLFLSIANELDVYIATSMRQPSDFQRVAELCRFLFEDESSPLQDLHVRWFDPTMSIADDPHDKGLVECLMVKMAKLLVYDGGVGDTFGKDAEAAMALSQGKVVLILCEEGLKATHDSFDPFGNLVCRAGDDLGKKRQGIFRDLHPLSRLVNMKSGVVVGAIVCKNRAELRDLILRVFTNEMQYELLVESVPKKHIPYMRLRERVTGCVVRLQTNYRMLAETFWNYYHEKEGT